MSTLWFERMFYIMISLCEDKYDRKDSILMERGLLFRCNLLCEEMYDQPETPNPDEVCENIAEWTTFPCMVAKPAEHTSRYSIFKRMQAITINMVDGVAKISVGAIAMFCNSTLQYKAKQSPFNKCNHDHCMPYHGVSMIDFA